MPERNHSKTNTVLLSIVLAFVGPGSCALGWGALEIYKEMRSQHDAIIQMPGQFAAQLAATKAEFDKEITSLRNDTALKVQGLETRLAELQSRIATQDLEIQRVRRDFHAKEATR